MGERTMEKLLVNLKEVTDEVNTIVKKQDVPEAKEVIARIEKLEEEIARREEAWGTIQFTEHASKRKAAYNRETNRLKEELKKLKDETPEVSESKDSEKEEDSDITEEIKKEDVKQAEEVKKIADKIFKVEEIKKELAERQISREEFLAFYKSGHKLAEENIKDLDEKEKEIDIVIENIFVDKDSDISLKGQLEDAIEKEDETKKIEVIKKIRQHMLEEGFNEELVKKEITTKEDAEGFIKHLDKFCENMSIELSEISNARSDLLQDKQLFDDEIKIIEDEIKTIRTIESKEIEGKASREKKLRAEQIKATMFGADKTLQEEWEKRFERFYAHKTKEVKTYVDKDGNEQKVEYETMEDYPHYKEDAYFLNLEDYKKHLEISTIYRNSGNDINALGAEIKKVIADAEAREKGRGEGLLEKYLMDSEEYVKTFHGRVNEHKVRYENYKTAGSTLKSMVSLKDLTPAKKVGAVTENVFRFLGVRKPKFMRIDENGKKVKDIKGGLMTLGTDALVVGGITATGIATGGAGLAVIGLGYAAKGAVTVGNLAAAGITKRKYKDEIENNIPTPFSQSKDSKEVARKDYYRREEGKGRFSSWVKAKNDRYFRRNRAKETEGKIVQERIGISNEEIDRRTEKARVGLGENLRRGRLNQYIRNDNFYLVSQDNEAYKDIVDDQGRADIKEATETVAQKAVTRQKEKDSKLEKTVELDEIKVEEGKTAADTAITREEHYTGRQQKQDRMNRIATIILTTTAKLGIDAVRHRFEQEMQNVPETENVKETAKEPVYDETTKMTGPEKLTDAKVDSNGLDNTYRGDTTNIAGDITAPGNPSQIADPAAASIQYIDKEGNEIVASIAEDGLGYTNQHVHGLGNFDMQNMTPTELIEKFKELDPEFYDKIAETMKTQGIDEANIPNELIKNGNLYLQDSKMSGWQQVDPSNIISKTEKVITGGYTDVQKEVAGVVDEAVNAAATNVNYAELAKSALEGIGTGVAIAGTEALHEAAHQTKKVRPGTFEQNNESLNSIFGDVIKEAQRKSNDRRKNREER